MDLLQRQGWATFTPQPAGVSAPRRGGPSRRQDDLSEFWRKSARSCATWASLLKLLCADEHRSAGAPGSAPPTRMASRLLCGEGALGARSRAEALPRARGRRPSRCDTCLPEYHDKNHCVLARAGYQWSRARFPCRRGPGGCAVRPKPSYGAIRTIKRTGRGRTTRTKKNN